VQRLTRRDRRQRGSLTVELVVLAPVMLLIMLFLVFAGRVIEAHGQVGGAARDAARAASIALSSGEANQGAKQAAEDDLANWCAGGPQTNVEGFVAGSREVTVTIHCTVDLNFIGFGSIKVTQDAVAPLDQFTARNF
jgi:Flp pilus assembly protein TadG